MGIAEPCELREFDDCMSQRGKCNPQIRATILWRADGRSLCVCVTGMPSLHGRIEWWWREIETTIKVRSRMTGKIPTASTPRGLSTCVMMNWMD